MSQTAKWAVWNADRRQPRRNRSEIPPTVVARVRSARHHKNAIVLLGQKRYDQHGRNTLLATVASHNQCPKLAAAVWMLPARLPARSSVGA